MIKIVSKSAGFGINVPTSRKELTKEYFDKLLKGVHLAKNHCIIALIYRDRLFSIMNTKATTVTVLPVIAKISNMDSSSTGYLPLQQAIIGNGDLERGYHLYLPNNVISPAYLNKFIQSDKSLGQAIATGKIYEDNHVDGKTCEVFTVEFKIVPIVDIRAAIDMDYKFVNPFKVK